MDTQNTLTMMSSAASILSCLTAALVAHRPSTALTPPMAHNKVVFGTNRKVGNRLLIPLSFSSSSSIVDDSAEVGISRLSTLLSLLSKCGAPGSIGCSKPYGDLVPIISWNDKEKEERLNLHPHLYPLAKSSTTGNYICALRRAYAEDQSNYESSTNAPWPIVESKLNGLGMRLLTLNSEHLMRRMACEADDSGLGEEIISIYNEGLGNGSINEKGLDSPYEAGSVAQLGYGVEKYTLLRVGPFPDLYQSMARQHAARGDEASSLIAAEASNSKFVGFGSSFAFYARLLATFPQREEESRDAARMCLRMPLPSMGLDEADFFEVSCLARIADPSSDSTSEAMAKMQLMYEKIRQHEEEENSGDNSKTPEQVAIDEANYLIDSTALTGARWGNIREKLGDIYGSVNREDMAKFVDPSRS